MVFAVLSISKEIEDSTTKNYPRHGQHKKTAKGYRIQYFNRGNCLER